MIATAHSGQQNTRFAELSAKPVQNVLLASYDRTESDQFSAYLDGFYRLFYAATERALFAILESHAIQLVIINTATTNAAEGIRLCSRLKAAAQSAHLPVILLMAHDNLESRLGCLRAGADACLEKPLSPDHLCAQVRNLLGNRDRLKTYFSQPFVSGLEPMIRTGVNQAFVNKLNGVIAANLHDADLNVDGLASMMNISKPTLYRKIKYLSKQTPNGLVNFIRLNKAAELLSTGQFKVFKIAQMVGFASRSNFGRSFVRQFGLTPKEYVRMIKNT